MKVASLLIFIAAISFIESSVRGFTDKTCTEYYNKQDEEHQAFSKDFCRSLGITEGGDKCCYIKYKTESGYYYNCVQVTMSDFYNIKEYRDSLETIRGWDIKSIECDSSSYLYASLLLLLVFLF